MGLELRYRAWQRMRLDFPIDQPFDSAARADEECAVVAFSHTLDAVRLECQRIELRRTGLPSPQSGGPSHPEIALAVLVRTGDSTAKKAILSVAPDAATLNRAEPPRGKLPPAGP